MSNHNSDEPGKITGDQTNHNRATHDNEHSNNVYHKPTTVVTRSANTFITAPLIASAITLFLIALLLLVFLFPARAPELRVNTDSQNEAINLLEQRRNALRNALSSFSCPINNSRQFGGQQETVLGTQASIAPSMLLPVAGPIDNAEKATVLILITGDPENENTTMGTGFFINDTDIVTNLHVTGKARDAVVINKALGKPMKALVIVRSSNQPQVGAPDFAILRLQSGKAPAILKIAPTIAKGDSIIAGGFPSVIMETDSVYRRLINGDLSAAPEMAVTQGMVTTFQQGVDGLELLLHTAAISSGNSGGPLLDYCGRVVGVNTFMRSGSANHTQLNFAQRSESLVHFLKKTNISFENDAALCAPQQANSVAQAPAAVTTPTTAHGANAQPESPAQSRNTATAQE